MCERENIEVGVRESESVGEREIKVEKGEKRLWRLVGSGQRGTEQNCRDRELRREKKIVELGGADDRREKRQGIGKLEEGK